MFGVSIACVASVSVGFGSKERPKKGIFGVFPREKWGEHHFSRGQNTKILFLWPSLLPNPTETRATQAVYSLKII